MRTIEAEELEPLSCQDQSVMQWGCSVRSLNLRRGRGIATRRALAGEAVAPLHQTKNGSDQSISPFNTTSSSSKVFIQAV